MYTGETGYVFVEPDALLIRKDKRHVSDTQTRACTRARKRFCRWRRNYPVASIPHDERDSVCVWMCVFLHADMTSILELNHLYVLTGR